MYLLKMLARLPVAKLPWVTGNSLHQFRLHIEYKDSELTTIKKVPKMKLQVLAS